MRNTPIYNKSGFAGGHYAIDIALSGERANGLSNRTVNRMRRYVTGLMDDYVVPEIDGLAPATRTGGEDNVTVVRTRLGYGLTKSLRVEVSILLVVYTTGKENDLYEALADGMHNLHRVLAIANPPKQPQTDATMTVVTLEALILNLPDPAFTGMRQPSNKEALSFGLLRNYGGSAPAFHGPQPMHDPLGEYDFGYYSRG